MTTTLPRFEAVTRRTFLQRSVLAGSASVLVAACSSGNGDASTFATTTTTSTSTTAPASSGGSTAGATTTAPGAASASSAVPAGDALPASASLKVSFTYTADGTGGRVRNPYIAVWIETPGGDLVNTVSVWFAQREAKYLRNLTRWYDAEVTLINGGGTDNVDSVSSATKVAGAYDVTWDGTDVDGTRVAAGEYVVCVESAREHGPVNLSVGSVTLGSSAAQVDLPDDGELSSLSAVYSV